MKIFQIIPSFEMGGAEIMCETLVYELKKMGHEVVVISLYSTETIITQRLKKANVDIRFLNKRSGFDTCMYSKLRSIFKEEKPDVVHTHLYVTKYVFPIAAKLKIKTIHTLHSVAMHEASRVDRLINKHYYKRCDVIPVVLSKKNETAFLNVYKMPVGFSHVIMNGVNLGNCIEKSDYQIHGNFKIVHVGRFTAEKNHKILIEAFDVFHKKHMDSELHLVGDGAERSEIERMVKERNLSEFVFFHGVLSSVFEYLFEMDIFTLTSLYEGVPMSVVEAMGTGLPIVATAVGGVLDMLNENNSQLVRVDKGEIAKAFEVYYLNRDLRERHGKCALKESNRFSSVTMAKKYVELYR